MNEQPATQPQRDRLLKVFEFLKAYLDLRYPPVRDIKQQMRTLWLNELPQHTSIEVFHTSSEADEESDDSDIVLRITRPTLTNCPTPPPAIAEWLKPGWQNFDAKPEYYLSRNAAGTDGRVRIERFEEAPQRPALFRRWQQERAEWEKNERPTRQSLAVFQSVYEWFGIHEREAERIELLVANGLLNCSAEDGNFNHQVLLQRLELEFKPEKRNPQFVFRKREQPPELYLEFLRALPEVNHQQIAKCADELKQTEISPLGGDDTEGFLRRLIQGIFPSGGQLLTAGEQPNSANPSIRRQPVIFMRQRRSGIGNVFDLVREDIAKRTEFATSLLQIVGLAGPISGASPDKPRASSPGNEDADVLLSKPANKEQLEIARQLARRDCVLVQGPPGTGKTHTIANLIGHLLAQGKRVLVTAHTPKALRVLRQKVVEPLQPLCISVLQNDKQSQEELQQSVRQISVRLSQNDHVLERDAERFTHERRRIIEQLSQARSRLLDARQDEIRGVVFGGKDIRPIDAAKRVKEGLHSDAWIPSPVKLGDALPLSHAEIVALYQTNARICLDDERQLNSNRPDVTSLATPKEFRELVEDLRALAVQNLRYREELWAGTSGPNDLAQFDKMLSLAVKAIEFLRDGAPWQLEAVQAGRDGAEARQVWLSLTELFENAWREVQECHALVMAHGPQVDDQRPPHELLSVVEEVIQHIEAGKSFGMLTKLTKPHCHKLIGAVHIGNRAPSLNETTHFRAVRALLRMKIIRQELSERWERQIAGQGGPPSSELTDQPEKVCRGFITSIQNCLDWHGSTWLTLEREFQRLGFGWNSYLESTPPETGANAELRRLRKAVVGELETILKARAGWLRQKHLESVWTTWYAAIPEPTGAEATVTQRLRQALRDASPADYQQAYDELVRLNNLEPDLQSRRSLLARLEHCAPAWASAIQNRHPVHSKPEPPGNPTLAWEWRQLHDELERRANVSLDDLQQQIERLNGELLEVTAQLVEKLTWVKLIRKTKHEQKQALGAFAAMRNKLTKTGKGVRDAELRAAARKEMTVAKGAVPVWIMPLNEVAETFDPRTTRFDVVIIDEASQCDPTAMFALYLGDQAIIVGDDEQVTPVAVGVEMEQIQRLIQIHLQGIPHKELYDGEFSIYEFAQIAFGGVIRLVEHFRCAPNIIAFSNALSYRGEIKPLREASSIQLSPHVVPHRVEGARIQNDDANDAEAEAIASLICAAMEQPEYAENDQGKPTSFGVVSLVGAQQAMKVDTLLRQHIEPAEYKRRQILCGDSAQFQGDERDVMMLSVVDAPPAEPPLPLRQEGPKKIFKKRFNVAASRARDQMWVVHSLNHDVDLKPGDYRRKLIEHAIDPEAWERELQNQLTRTESVFEKRVLTNLAAASFIVQPQFKVGSYRIDLVVVGDGKRLAIECDGERFHGPEKLWEDMERQAILERLGWQFLRVRGSVFFRDEDRAMQPIFRRLDELGITPGAKLSNSESPVQEDALVQRVIRRAQELRGLWKKEQPSTEKSQRGEDARSSRTRRSGNALGQDDFHLT
jgi:very-short-patch-repair endonuclease